MIKKIKKYYQQKVEEKRIKKEEEEVQRKKDHITYMRHKIANEVWEACKQENMQLDMYDVCHDKLNECLTKYRMSQKHYLLMLGSVYYAYGLWWGGQGLIRNSQAIDYFRKGYAIDPHYLDIYERLNKAIERNNSYVDDKRSNSVLGMLMHQGGKPVRTL